MGPVGPGTTEDSVPRIPVRCPFMTITHHRYCLMHTQMLTAVDERARTESYSLGVTWEQSTSEKQGQPSQVLFRVLTARLSDLLDYKHRKSGTESLGLLGR